MVGRRRRCRVVRGLGNERSLAVGVIAVVGCLPVGTLYSVSLGFAELRISHAGTSST